MSIIGLATILIGSLCVFSVAAGLVVLAVMVLQNRGSHQEAVTPGTPGAQISQAVNSSSAGQIGLDEPTMAELRKLIQQNRILNAIHLYRQATGVGLSEARHAVEALRNDKTA